MQSPANNMCIVNDPLMALAVALLSVNTTGFDWGTTGGMIDSFDSRIMCKDFCHKGFRCDICASNSSADGREPV